MPPTSAFRFRLRLHSSRQPLCFLQYHSRKIPSFQGRYLLIPSSFLSSYCSLYSLHLLWFSALWRWFVPLYFGYQSAQSWVRYHIISCNILFFILLSLFDQVHAVNCLNACFVNCVLISLYHRHSLIIPKSHYSSLEATPPSVSNLPYLLCILTIVIICLSLTFLGYVLFSIWNSLYNV